MSLHIDCEGCGNELSAPGALLFSPPKHDSIDTYRNSVEKRHLCQRCYGAVARFIEHGIDETAAAGAFSNGEAHG